MYRRAATTPANTAPLGESDRRHPAYGWLRYAALLASVAFLIWLLRIDMAQFRLFQGIRHALNDDFAAARERINDARSLDPSLRLYDLQEAYVLGLQADENPSEYLDAAIAAYEQILQDDPNFDVGRANLAALYAQQGSYQQAIEQVEYALDIRPGHQFLLAESGPNIRRRSAGKKTPPNPMKPRCDGA